MNLLALNGKLQRLWSNMTPLERSLDIDAITIRTDGTIILSIDQTIIIPPQPSEMKDETL